MSQSALESASIYSSFGDDPDLGELVEMFVDEMSERVANLTGCANEKDWDGLGRFAHQIKGAAGSYGFDQITPFAAKVESACKTGLEEEEIMGSLNDLVNLLEKAKAGVE